MEVVREVIIETPAQKREREISDAVIGSLVYERIRNGNIPPEWTPRDIPERPVAHERVVYNSDLVARKPDFDNPRYQGTKEQRITEATMRDTYCQRPGRNYELPPIKRG